jgi:hypothetical protein
MNPIIALINVKLFYGFAGVSIKSFDFRKVREMKAKFANVYNQ